MRKLKILWVDDEIEILKPHIIFLENKGYEVSTVSNGNDAIDAIQEQNFDIIFLDENMPGLSGLETLKEIKSFNSTVPVVMITKSEEENIMDEAIGSQISDYLIKPVNPKQILLALKKHTENKKLIAEKVTSSYQAEFGKIGMELAMCNNIEDWYKLFQKLVYWEIELDKNSDSEMEEVFIMQKNEANNEFAKFIKKNYENWFDKNVDERPLMSQGLMREKVFPLLEKKNKVFFILIDNLRFDQWKTIEPLVSEYFNISDETPYLSILPTATQYARNALFAGLMPLEIESSFPDLWLNDEEEGRKNEYEDELFQRQLNRLGKNYKFYYEKIFNNRGGKKVVDNIKELLQNDINILVYNFVDMLSHARTEMQMIRELADDEPAYRSLTLSWFTHSPLLDLLKELSTQNVKVILTTDHGTIRVFNPVKVIGDKKTSTNLRYKQGKNLNYKAKDVLEIHKPEKIHLPKSHVSSKYIFAMNNDFIAYPNNYNYYVSYYKNTFQHGGISLDEMIIPFVSLEPKK